MVSTRKKLGLPERCACGETELMHEEHIVDERIYQRRGSQRRRLVRTAKDQLLSERWYCVGCMALVKEKP